MKNWAIGLLYTELGTILAKLAVLLKSKRLLWYAEEAILRSYDRATPRVKGWLVDVPEAAEYIKHIREKHRQEALG